MRGLGKGLADEIEGLSMIKVTIKRLPNIVKGKIRSRHNKKIWISVWNKRTDNALERGKGGLNNRIRG
jgi:hypothetical protein